MGTQTDRCRLVLNAHPDVADVNALQAAVADGYVSSCILYPGTGTEAEFDNYCQHVVPLLQEQDVAVLIADKTRTVGRSGADGIFLEKERNRLDDVVERYSPDQIVGCGGFKDRHGALQAGESKPDFVFFGKLGGDIRAEAHPKNLALSQWWSEVIEIPGVVLAGTSLESIVECARTGADFVAIEAYAFSGSMPPAQAIRIAEEQLEQHAPRFEEVEA